MLCCVRPEEMTVVDAGSEAAEVTGTDVGSGGGEPGNTLDATVSKTEFLGESTRSHLRWNGRELTVRSPDPLAGAVRVGFAPAAAHVIEVGRERDGEP